MDDIARQQGVAYICNTQAMEEKGNAMLHKVDDLRDGCYLDFLLFKETRAGWTGHDRTGDVFCPTTWPF